MDRTERRNKIHNYSWEIQSPTLSNKKQKQTKVSNNIEYFKSTTNQQDLIYTDKNTHPRQHSIDVSVDHLLREAMPQVMKDSSTNLK